MSRSQRVVFISMVVVALGAVGALGAFFLDPARAAVGPLAADGLLLPADARFVIGIDVKRFTASPLYKRFTAQARPDALGDLEEKTGLNLERDVDQVLIAGRPSGSSGAGVAIVLGSFDNYKLGRAIETNAKGKSAGRSFLGYTEYVFNETGKEAGALALLDGQALLIGTKAEVEAALTAKSQGTTPLRTNVSIMGLLEQVKPGSTVWMVGDQSLLQNLPSTIPAPGAGGSGNSITLPALKSVIVTGDLDPMLSLSMTGDTPDEAAAKNLGDIMRGFVALASLQASQRPEFKDLASAISVTTEANRVHVNARIPYEMLDALRPKKAAAAPAAIGR
jgi:hypothetical protein